MQAKHHLPAALGLPRARAKGSHSLVGNEGARSRGWSRNLLPGESCLLPPDQLWVILPSGSAQGAHPTSWTCLPRLRICLSQKQSRLQPGVFTQGGKACAGPGIMAVAMAMRPQDSVGLGLHSEVPLRDSWSCSRTPFTSRGLPVLQQRRCPWLMPVARGLSVLPAQTVGSDPLTGTGRALGLETCVIHHSLSDAEGFPQAVGKAQTRVFETGPEHTPHRQTKYGFNPA